VEVVDHEPPGRVLSYPVAGVAAVVAVVVAAAVAAAAAVGGAVTAVGLWAVMAQHLRHQHIHCLPPPRSLKVLGPGLHYTHLCKNHRRPFPHI